MFTGIIEQIGEVVLNKEGELQISVPASFARDIKIGSSIAVNGACLTINQKSKIKNLAGKVKSKNISFCVIGETLRRTNLGLLKNGDRVNLEKALKVGDRFEGHIVQGHVDKKSKVKSQKSKVRKDGGKEIILTIEIFHGLKKYIVPKGSIAIDGVSLTVVDVGKNFFTTAIIPHTWENTIVKYYKKGALVNIEVDILAKLVRNRAF